MSSPSDAAPDRSPVAGEETKSRLSRKRVTVITATALSLLEACGLEPSPSRSEKTAGKGPKTAQDAAPAGKAPADDREKKQAADPASSRSRNTSRKKTPPSGKIPRTDAGNLPEEDASLAFATGNVLEVPPVVPSDGAAPAAATPPEPVVPPKTSARRRRVASAKAVSVPDGGRAPTSGAEGQVATPVAGPSVDPPAVEAVASGPGEEQSHAAAKRAPSSRVRRSSTSGGRGRKKAAELPPAPVAEAVPTVAPEAQQAPARPMDAAALAAEADRLAAEYGLSSSGGGLVVLPGDDDWDDFPAPRDEDAPSPQTAARSAVTAPVASFPEPAPAEARSVMGSSSVPASEPGPVVKSASRRRAAGTKAAAVPGGGACPAADAGEQGASPVPTPIGVRTVPSARPAPSAQAGASLPDAGSGDGKAYASVRPGTAPVAAGPSGSTPPSGTGMGKREAAFRQWAADMQARFDAGLEAEEDRAARRKDTLVVI